MADSILNDFSLQFDGSQYCVNSRADWQTLLGGFTGGFSWGAWVNQNNNTQAGDVIAAMHEGEGATGFDRSWVLKVREPSPGSRFEWQLDIFNGAAVDDVVSIAFGTDTGGWHHIGFAWTAGTFDFPSTVRAFQNGLEQTLSFIVGTPDDLPALMLGGSEKLSYAALDGGTSNLFPGQMDEITLWSTPFEEADFAELYNDGNAIDALTHTQSAALEQWLRCGDGVNDLQLLSENGHLILTDQHDQGDVLGGGDVGSNSMELIDGSSDILSRSQFGPLIIALQEHRRPIIAVPRGLKLGNPDIIVYLGTQRQGDAVVVEPPVAGDGDVGFDVEIVDPTRVLRVQERVAVPIGRSGRRYVQAPPATVVVSEQGPLGGQAPVDTFDPIQLNPIRYWDGRQGKVIVPGEVPGTFEVTQWSDRVVGDIAVAQAVLLATENPLDVPGGVQFDDSGGRLSANGPDSNDTTAYNFLTDGSGATIWIRFQRDITIAFGPDAFFCGNGFGNARPGISVSRDVIALRARFHTLSGTIAEVRAENSFGGSVTDLFVTTDGSTMRLFVNSTSEADSAALSDVNDPGALLNPFVIGDTFQTFDSGAGADATIFQVGLFGRVLPGAELQQLIDFSGDAQAGASLVTASRTIAEGAGTDAISPDERRTLESPLPNIVQSPNLGEDS